MPPLQRLISFSCLPNSFSSMIETIWFSEVITRPYPLGLFALNAVITKSFSHIEEAHIKENAVIGPFARLRPGAIIGDSTKIGNFVEIKNSLLGENTKVGHLTYVGDATIGDNVNIGAGTVFCNYDGKKKHKSIVQDNVFIGSNTSIISPIVMKNNAKIAAGTVVTKDVDKSQLCISRVPQKNI